MLRSVKFDGDASVGAKQIDFHLSPCTVCLRGRAATCNFASTA
jgi:hypothetical protein